MRKLGNLFSRALALLWSLLPWRVNLLLGRLLAFIWFDVLRLRRDVVYRNLKTAFPEITPAEQKRVAKISMVTLCRSFLDVLKVPYLSEKWIDRNVVFDGFENIRALREEDGGVLLLTLHMGSGDLAAAVVSDRIRPLALISKRFSNRFLDAFWFGLRERSKTRFIDAHAKNNAFDILTALKEKRGVVFVLDQFMGKPYGVESRFFGVTTGTAYGLALFARKTRRPVFPLYTYWDVQGRLHICVEQPIDLSGELGQTNEEMTNTFNRALEKIIARHPEHWMWVHKRWKTFE